MTASSTVLAQWLSNKLSFHNNNRCMILLQAAAVDDGRMTQVIGNLERELQAKVDAKMKLASDSHVYERLSEDIKSKAAILAALKATLGPVTDMVSVA